MICLILNLLFTTEINVIFVLYQNWLYFTQAEKELLLYVLRIVLGTWRCVELKNQIVERAYHYKLKSQKNSVCTYFMIPALFQMNKNPNCHNNWINKTLSTPIFVIAFLNKLVLEELRKLRVDWMKKYCKNIKLN